ncbi:MAG: molybdenum cofactor guanylyltransferase [Betaproteobacteria bacterium CG2_30_59_46]|nr:MAG: molybdenum cofactor guanylyltransferase [Betaproteobacteria bacterium CG2_30_59_46]PIQ12315.1 MAG: molybdenum cofactor guanylyltransferase MobA [Hydrogenophilales bacterium CG18_big_fil_WC_8_21_14_2_50_58_12]PIY01579.1 MAG: molybdenum cofactor guanylyltransferase MobA [Hydrogenophilales bacterium CG_4_10_14_3_um_filter_58_23]
MNSSAVPTERLKISAVILAGGRARRMGGADKGLVLLNDRPLIAWVLKRIAPQVDELFISANRNLDQYRLFGYPVLPDASPDLQGPLAGLLRAMTEAAHPLVLSVPCDTPFLPDDLVGRLTGALEESGADIAIPVCGGQVHRAVCLCRCSLLPGLENFLAQGGRRVGEWQSMLKSVEVPFDDERSFLNLNTADELAASGSEQALFTIASSPVCGRGLR